MSTSSNDPMRDQRHDLAARSSAPAPGAPAATPSGGVTPVAPLNLAATAIGARTQRQSRARLHQALARVLGHRRVRSRTALAMLAAEDDRIDPGRNPDLTTHGEALVLARGKERADAALARSQCGIDKQARRIGLLQFRRSRLIVRADYRAGDLVRHPDGGLRPVREVVRDEASQRAEIADDRANGSRKHQRLPSWLGRTPQLVLVVDFSLLLYFFAGITDVNWASPLSADLVFAVLLAVMVTVLSYGFLAFTGHRLRSHKDHSGAIPLADLDSLTRAAAAAAAGAIVVLATLMFTRMWTEVLDALGPDAGTSAFFIALTLAVVSILANSLVTAIHALDGSDQVARLEALSSATARPLARAHKMHEKADIIPGRIALRRRRVHRDAARAIAKAGRHLAAVDRVIDAAHAHHQAAGTYADQALDPGQHDGVVGYRDPAGTPAPDLRPLHITLAHVNTELPDTVQPQAS